MEFTTHLPCTQRNPASITSNFEESIMIGTFEISGSLATSWRNLVMAAAPSSMPSSMLMSIICAPASTCWRATASASSYWLPRMSWANLGDPVTLVRSPTLMNGISGRAVNGSSPLSRKVRVRSGIRRGLRSLVAATMAAMWSGVVPQQPPMMFNHPCSAQSRNCGANDAAVSGNPVSESGSGRPALG